MAIKTETKQVKIDKAMLTKAMQVQTAPPPKSAYKIDRVNGTDVFESCMLQFGKIPEVSGYMFVVAYDNPNLILAAYAPGTWARAVLVADEELAGMKAEVEKIAEWRFNYALPNEPGFYVLRDMESANHFFSVDTDGHILTTEQTPRPFDVGSFDRHALVAGPFKTPVEALNVPAPPTKMQSIFGQVEYETPAEPVAEVTGEA